MQYSKLAMTPCLKNSLTPSAKWGLATNRAPANKNFTVAVVAGLIGAGSSVAT